MTLDIGGEALPMHRVMLKFTQGDAKPRACIEILTNLPEDEVKGTRVVELYRKQWTLETMFQSLTTMLASEQSTLGYPRAALMGFGIALLSYNIISTVQAGLRGAFGIEKIQEKVSGYYIANEVRKHHEGMSIALPAPVWQKFQRMSPAELATLLVTFAAHTNLGKFKHHPRGPNS